MIGTHTLAEADVDAAATGLGGADLVRRLWAGQRSRRLRWVWQVLDRADGPEGETVRAATVRAAKHAPEAVSELLVRPMVGAWAAKALHPDTSSDELHLGALALSAAQCAGTAAEATIPARSGWVGLPGSGMVRAASERPRLTTDHGRLWVDGQEITPGDQWWQPRPLTITGSPSLEILIEDVDPHRDLFQIPAADRLSAAAFTQWQHDLTAGWDLVTRYAPERAVELAVGLHSLVPLSRPDGRASHSATSTTTVGVIGLDDPSDPAELAITLVHELQHSKLAALHHITPLYEPDHGETIFRVPWRVDRRPLSGALQGLYAFTGVADTWRALRAVPELAAYAEIRFAEAAAFVRGPAREVKAAERLTPSGQRFAAGLATAVDALLSVPISKAARTAAERSLAAHQARWEP